MDSSQFCHMLKGEMKAHGLTYWQMASRMGRNKTSVYELLDPRNDSRMKSVFKFLRGLRTDIALIDIYHREQVIHTFDDLHTWVCDAYAGRDSESLSHQFQTSEHKMQNILKGCDFPVSIFLAMADDQKVAVRLIPENPVTSYGAIDDFDFELHETPIARFGETDCHKFPVTPEVPVRTKTHGGYKTSRSQPKIKLKPYREIISELYQRGELRVNPRLLVLALWSGNIVFSLIGCSSASETMHAELRQFCEKVMRMPKEERNRLVANNRSKITTVQKYLWYKVKEYEAKERECEPRASQCALPKKTQPKNLIRRWPDCSSALYRPDYDLD